MMPKECSLIQELFPLYAENLVNEETVEYIKEHLAGCPSCAQEWEEFNQPLPDPLPQAELAFQKGSENKLFSRLKKTITVAVLLLVAGGSGLAYASYYAGKHVGIDDPAYRFAQELDLFTEIKQTKTADGIQVTLDKGLFDSTRSVLFVRLSSPGSTIGEVTLADEEGRQYEQKSGKGWQNKYFMLEFEPLALEAKEINVSMTLGDQQQAQAEFTFPVDVVKAAQFTRIIYPNQEKKLSHLKITLEKAVLGVSESEFKVRFDWPVDGSVAGIGLGRGTAYFPTSVTEAPDTPPPPGLGSPPPGGLVSSYAATYGVNYRSEDPPENRPALYDLTGRQEVTDPRGEYKTTQFPCQVVAELKFAPVTQETEQLELLLPPVYVYEKVKEGSEIVLNFRKEHELDLERTIPYREGRIIMEKAWLEETTVYLSYRVESSGETDDTTLPHFLLQDDRGMEQGQPRFDRENLQVVMFSLLNEEAEELSLCLDSIGYLLPREKFSLDLREE